MMKKLLRNVPLLLIALIAVSASAQEAPHKGWYAGINLGIADWGDQIPNSFNGEATDKDTKYGLFAGYNFNRFVAMEGEWTDLGELDLDARPGFGPDEKTSAHGFRLSAVGMIPLDRLVLYGKLGGFASIADRTYNGRRSDHRDGGVTWSIGADYKVTQKWLVGLSYVHYELEWLDLDLWGSDGANTDVDVMQMSVHYRF